MLQAGLYYGIMGSVTTVYGFIVGMVIDKFGVKRSLIIGSLLSTIGRLGVGLTDSPLILGG
jgi:hypothetical protein